MKSTTLCYSRTFKVLGQSGIRIKDTSEDRFSGRVSKKNKTKKTTLCSQKNVQKRLACTDEREMWQMEGFE